jgi:Tol biopolymer transport system component
MFTVGADGSGKRRLASSRTRGYIDPSWSPDGGTISKERLGRGFELYPMALSDIVRVTTNPRADLFPDWQPLP